MNTRTLIASLSLAFAAASPVMAQEASPSVPHISGQLSRAEVAAGAAQAVQSGRLHERYQIQARTAVHNGLSRDMVRADTVAALHNGEVARLSRQAPVLGLMAPAHGRAMSAAHLSR